MGENATCWCFEVLSKQGSVTDLDGCPVAHNGEELVRTLLFLLEGTFSGVFLWLGLYLITRDNPAHDPQVRRWWQSPAVAMGAALVCVAWYLAGMTMIVISDDPRKVGLWMRLGGWATALACPPFLWSVILVTTDEETSLRARLWGHIASLLVLTYALTVATVGTMTDLLFRFEAIYRAPYPPYYLVVPPRFPFYALWVVLILGTLLASTSLLFRRMYATRDDARGRLRWLGTGTALITLGAVVGFVASIFPRASLPPELGDALLVVGLLMMGVGVARHNALLQHQVITQDFYRSLAGVVLTSTLFVLVFGGFHWLSGARMSSESIPLLIWLATLTVTLRPWVSERLDRMFLPRAVVGVRRVLHQASEQLVTAENQEQALLKIEHQVPETITATLEDLKLRELQASIERDINKLFYKTNYTGSGSDDYIIRNTGLLDLAIVEDTATDLMVKDGISPAVGREHYQLKALRQIIRGLVEDMSNEASSEDADKAHQVWHTILHEQFIKDTKRADVQRIIINRFRTGYGGAYGRLLNFAKKDLAKRLYLAERKAREMQGRTVEDVPV